MLVVAPELQVGRVEGVQEFPAAGVCEGVATPKLGVGGTKRLLTRIILPSASALSSVLFAGNRMMGAVKRIRERPNICELSSKLPRSELGPMPNWSTAVIAIYCLLLLKSPMDQLHEGHVY